MAEHTPGPWKVNRRLVERLPSGAEFYDTEIVTAWEHPQLKGPVPVVCRYTHLKGDGTAEHGVYIRPADAALIAAAPGLLEVCRAALAWLTKAKYYCGDGVAAKKRTRLIDRLEAALEMAEGRDEDA